MNRNFQVILEKYKFTDYLPFPNTRAPYGTTNMNILMYVMNAQCCLGIVNSG